STTNQLTVVPKPIKDAVTIAITEFAAQDGQAFQLVNGFRFINLAEQLFSSGKLMSSSPNIHIADILTDPTTISRQIDRMYAHRGEQLIIYLRLMGSYCFTVDFCISYCGLSLIHIDLECQSHTFVLDCFPYELDNKWAPTSRSFVDDILHTFSIKLDEEKYVMSDNEPTMKRTFSQASILDNKLLTIYLRIGKDLLTGLCEFLLPFDTVLDTLSDNELSVLHRVLLFK
ncbi:unnamed protein product, partial [Rotaria sordida]